MISSRKLRKLKKFRKVLLLLMLVVMTTTVLIVETYAWYAGFSTSSVDTFDVSISSSDGLELSLDGSTWSTSGLTLTKSGILNAYTGNTNKWADYLSPVSTIGEMNTSASKLKLFKADSLSASAGGYRLVGSQVSNSTTEGEGYIAFDLFIRNGKGSTYSSTYTQNTEEDVFLSGDSFAVTNVTGTTPNYGSANSIRVGFFEIGRMKSSGYNADTLRGIQCNGGTGVTGLCATSSNMSDRQFATWNIWEPNYASHATNLVNYFNTACRTRGNVSGVTYSNNRCNIIDTGYSRVTYAMNSSITTNDSYVDIYDGRELNYYGGTTKLSIVDTYKTTDATTTGNNKRALIKLGGNSVTKVRVYIWLEGQDIDNYDVITKNPTMSIKFGFTKDRNGIDNTNNTGINNRTSSFQDDSWKRIQYNIQHGNTDQYKLGDERELVMNGNTYRLRLVNKTSPSGVCSGSTNSQTACGFVVEFVDSVTQLSMFDTLSTSGGYPASNIYSYLNNTLINQIPKDLKDIIINTRVVSGHNNCESSNYTSPNQKFFLISSTEYYGNSPCYDNTDTASNQTRQFDYYIGKVYIDHYCKIDHLKKYVNHEGAESYWLRNPESSGCRISLQVNGTFLYSINSAGTAHVFPAFRIG